ncbi:MAG: 3-hydroxyacyl-CoA dehydrogenase family protein [Deltaproteobacteria bacterium]|nr:3-hydroxyacyl-CoA dehydrogenase family protein [Deltaproteobacteria bacterium]
MNIDSIDNVTVIGIGVMGPDISLKFALSGYQVVGVDILSAAVEAAQVKVRRNLEQMVSGGMLSQVEAEQALARLEFTLDWEAAVKRAHFVTEAVPEDLAIKKEVFSRCDGLLPPGIIIASNTSSMSISQISEGMRHPERALGTHWTIPAHLSPMVEVIKGRKSADQFFDLAMALFQRMGKRPVPSRENPGFIHNYVQLAMVSAALDLVDAGLATPQDVDTVVKNGFGLRLSSVGPVEFVDMCGLDTILNIQRYMFQTTENPVYKPSESIREKVARGDLGVKSGKGFYDYQREDSEDFWERTNRNIVALLQSLARVAAAKLAGQPTPPAPNLVADPHLTEVSGRTVRQEG